MPKRSSMKPPPNDENEATRSVLDHVVENTDEVEEITEGAVPKNPAAVALGRLGGKKGGPARARKLAAKRRVEIARKAAKARWTKRTDSTS